MKYALINKIAGLLPEMEAHGTVYVFAFAEREDIDGWDVILSSDWSDRDISAAIRVVADALVSRLVPDELTMIARVAIVPSYEPNVQELPASLDGVGPEDEKVLYLSFLGSDVRRVFVFRAQRPPVTSIPLPLALAGTGHS